MVSGCAWDVFIRRSAVAASGVVGGGIRRTLQATVGLNLLDTVNIAVPRRARFTMR